MAGSTAVIYRSGVLSVKASGGTIYGITGKSPVSGFLKIFDKASQPSFGTDTPYMILPILGNVPFDYEFAEGVATQTGIQLVATAHEAPLDFITKTDPVILQATMTATFRFA